MFVDIRIFLQIFLEHVDTFLKIFLLVFVLLLNLGVHLHLGHALAAEFVLQVSGMLHQFLLVLD
jgi:hypothetical protein